MRAGVTAIYDACVLYPLTLRCLLLDLGRTGLVRAKWTDAIHEEWTAAVLKNKPHIQRAQLERMKQLMDAYVLDCKVAGYESHIEHVVLPDPKDRHVVAAAIESGASVIVTRNLQDFPTTELEKYGIVAMDPDAFCMELARIDADEVLRSAANTWKDFENPSLTRQEFFDALSRQGLHETICWMKDRL